MNFFVYSNPALNAQLAVAVAARTEEDVQIFLKKMQTCTHFKCAKTAARKNGSVTTDALNQIISAIDSVILTDEQE